MYSAVSTNKRRTWLLIGGFVAFVTALGYVLGLTSNRPGLLYFFGIGALVYSFISYWMSDRITLSLAGAKPIAKADAPELYRLVENLSIASGLPMPRVYIINDESPNAFATGRDPKHAAIAVTT
jgi:heat shock protein HtpX